MKSVVYKIELFLAALIWGSSFFIVKNTVDIFPSNILLGIRFTTGFLLLCIIFHKKLKKTDLQYIVKGGLLGLFLFVAYLLQTIGITDTTPGKNAFLTAIYCILVPFFFWFVNKTRPDRYNISAAIICIGGIGLVSLDGDFSIRFGDWMTLAGGVVYAVHMVAVAIFSKNNDSILLTIYQFGFAAVFAWIAGLFTEKFPSASLITTESILGIAFLAIFCTTIALLLQNIAQKHVSPSSASIILSLESVFGVLFSVIFYGETLTLRLILGFSLIFIAILISETKLSFLHRNKA